MKIYLKIEIYRENIEKGWRYLIFSAIICGFPQNIENGWRAGYFFTYGNSVKYSCNDGYELIGIDQLTCMEDQKWSGVPPQCIGIVYF